MCKSSILNFNYYFHSYCVSKTCTLPKKNYKKTNNGLDDYSKMLTNFFFRLSTVKVVGLNSLILFSEIQVVL